MPDTAPLLPLLELLLLEPLEPLDELELLEALVLELLEELLLADPLELELELLELPVLPVLPELVELELALLDAVEEVVDEAVELVLPVCVPEVPELLEELPLLLPPHAEASSARLSITTRRWFFIPSIHQRFLGAATSVLRCLPRTIFNVVFAWQKGTPLLKTTLVKREARPGGSHAGEALTQIAKSVALAPLRRDSSGRSPRRAKRSALRCRRRSASS